MKQDKLRMQMLAGIITEGQYQAKINEGSDAIIPKSLVTRYANMKSLFGDKAKDPSVISKLIPIITDFFPKNLDVSYQKLVDKFGEETANQVQTVLLGAYLDGYLDRFQEPITRLNSERDTKYPDYMGERNKVDESNEDINYDEIDSILGGTYKRPEIAIDPKIQKIADILDKLISQPFDYERLEDVLNALGPIKPEMLENAIDAMKSKGEFDLEDDNLIVRADTYSDDSEGVALGWNDVKWTAG
jgi:hypothetical protein